MTEDYVGENFVCMVGKITKPKFKELDNNNFMFKATLAIPAFESGYQYVKVGAWGTNAEYLGELKSGTYIKIHGHLEESSYNGTCRHCGGQDKKYWTEIIIDNFKIL